MHSSGLYHNMFFQFEPHPCGFSKMYLLEWVRERNRERESTQATSCKRFVHKYCKLGNFMSVSLNKFQSKCSKCFIYACTIHFFKYSILLIRFVLQKQKTRLNNPEGLNQSYLSTILQVLWLQEQCWCIVFWVRWELAPCYWKIKC